MTEYAIWGSGELFQAFLGCMWVGLFLSFLLFLQTYRKYQRLGLTDKSYQLAFKDL
jgi:hypothetical protein